MAQLRTAEVAGHPTKVGNLFDGGVDKAIESAIVALEELDARRLEMLAVEAELAASGGTGYRPLDGLPNTELLAAVPQHRVLGCLLRETERNLKLLARLSERNREAQTYSQHG